MVPRLVYYIFFLFLVIQTACKGKNDIAFGDPARVPDQTDSIDLVDSNNVFDLNNKTDSGVTIVARPDATIYTPGAEIKTGSTIPDSLVAFGKSLVGTPYLYASSDPSKGFDCSGFITYVFNHFGIAVPRSSVDFTNVGREIPTETASPGDLILFTGTDSTIRIVGHMGIVESNEKGNLLFIHSTSGKAKSVVITPLKGYYEARFVKAIRVFPDIYF